MTDKKSNTIDRALMAQQKEQLRQLVLQRFIADYGKGKKSNIDVNACWAIHSEHQHHR